MPDNGGEVPRLPYRTRRRCQNHFFKLLKKYAAIRAKIVSQLVVRLPLVIPECHPDVMRVLLVTRSDYFMARQPNEHNSMKASRPVPGYSQIWEWLQQSRHHVVQSLVHRDYLTMFILAAIDKISFKRRCVNTA